MFACSKSSVFIAELCERKARTNMFHYIFVIYFIYIRCYSNTEQYERGLPTQLYLTLTYKWVLRTMIENMTSL